MPRRPTPKSNETCHITVRCNNKQYLFDLASNFNAMICWMNSLPLFFSVKLHHVLLMSNHIHMMVTPTEDNLGQAMSYMLTNMAKYLNGRNGTINHIFGARYAATIIKDQKYLVNVIRYIYQNPLKANLVSSIFQYKYSSLPQYLGVENHGLFISPDFYTFKMFGREYFGRREWIDWVRTPFREFERDIIRNSLKRSTFKFTKDQFIQMRKSQSTIVI